MDWALTAVGLTGFVLAGRKVWWAWYVNLACQALWMIYALTTQQYGFIVAALAYTVVFTRNSIKWTREHRVARSKVYRYPITDWAGKVIAYDMHPPEHYTA